MKANIKIVLVLLSLSFSAQAQVSDFHIEWSENIEVKKSLTNDIFYTGDPDIFYTESQSFKFSDRGIYLEKYENLKPTAKQKLSVEYSLGTVTQRQNVLELNDHLYAMEEHSSRENISLKAQYIDKENLSITNEKIDIYNFKLFNGRYYSYGEYFHTVSNSEERVGYVIEHPGTETSKSVATVKVFDDLFDLKWKTKISLKSTKELTYIRSVNISNDGIVYILTQVARKKEDRERDERNYEYYLVTVDEGGLQSEEKLELKENYIKSAKLSVTDNGNLTCGGFYSKEGSKVDGVFFMTLDAKSLEITQSSFKEFEMGFLTEGLSERQKAKAERKKSKGKEVGLTHVSFREIIKRDDGGALLIGEFINIYTVTTRDINTGRTESTTHYRYNEIYVINISPKGQIEWAKKIPKYQYSQDDYGIDLGFFSVVKDDKIHFIFNDHPDNEGEMDPLEIRNYSQKLKLSTLMLVSMDNDGSYTREILVQADKKAKERLIPKSCEQISEDEIILFAISRKYNKFARVKVE
jgi:hypothetical protein